jgi:hypothetical protein
MLLIALEPNGHRCVPNDCNYVTRVGAPCAGPMGPYRTHVGSHSLSVLWTAKERAQRAKRLLKQHIILWRVYSTSIIVLYIDNTQKLMAFTSDDALDDKLSSLA